MADTKVYPTAGAEFFARTGKSMMQVVLEDEFSGDPCEGFAGLLANRALNTGGGRPSDAARYVARLHRDEGCTSFRARYEAGVGSNRTLAEAAGSLA